VKKAAATNECTLVAGHFDGHAEAMKQYMGRRPMQHVQGYSGSHWTLPSGDYSLIGLLLAPYYPCDRQSINQQNNNAKYTHFAGCFDGHREGAVPYPAHCPMEGVQGFHKSY
jgi:hypothetical protein